MKILSKRNNVKDLEYMTSIISENGCHRFVDQFSLPFNGEVYWDKIPLPEGLAGFPQIRYIDYLLDVVCILNNFFVDSEPNLQKCFMDCLAFLDSQYYMCCLVNNTDDNYVYVLMSSCESLPENANGVIDSYMDKPYIGHSEMMEFIFNEQMKYDSFAPTSSVNYPCYFRSTPSELLDEFIPCFEENITDIPKDSIVWKTPYMINTMKKFAALKEYRKTLS